MSELAASWPPSRRRRLRRGDESGAAILEFAIVFVLFTFLVYGLIAYGMVLATKQRITNAAADGARAAVGAPDFGTAQTLARQRVHDALGSPGKYTEAYTDVLCDPANPLTSPHCIRVDLSYDYAHHPIVPVPELPGLHLFTPPSFGAQAVVQWS